MQPLRNTVRLLVDEIRAHIDALPAQEIKSKATRVREWIRANRRIILGIAAVVISIIIIVMVAVRRRK